jgi:hypothetical protein
VPGIDVQRVAIVETTSVARAVIGIECDCIIISLSCLPFLPSMETKTARLTILIDPAKKEAFEKLCAAQDLTSSQVVRQLIREYLERHDVTYKTKSPLAKRVGRNAD